MEVEKLELDDILEIEDDVERAEAVLRYFINKHPNLYKEKKMKEIKEFDELCRDEPDLSQWTNDIRPLLEVLTDKNRELEILCIKLIENNDFYGDKSNWKGEGSRRKEIIHDAIGDIGKALYGGKRARLLQSDPLYRILKEQQ